MRKAKKKLSLFRLSWTCCRIFFDLCWGVLHYKKGKKTVLKSEWINCSHQSIPLLSTPRFIGNDFGLMLSPSVFALLLESILGLTTYKCCTVVASLQQLHPQKPAWLNRFGNRCRWWLVWGFQKVVMEGGERHVCKSCVLYGPLFPLA